MADREVVLEVREVSKKFPGVLALNKVNLTLYKGEVLALIGENGAGKSTLMKILLGEYQKSSGEIFYLGKPFAAKNPAEALQSGITMIHQEISAVPSMTVAENIWLGREKRFCSGGFLNKAKMREATAELLQRLDIPIDPDAQARKLSVAALQLVEIARSVSYEANVIIMDEPTSALTETEIQKLYRIIRDLSAQGRSIIFISHKLDELFEICDRITVLRDGCYVDTKSIDEITRDDLIRMMVGREITNMYPKEKIPIGEELFRVEHLSRSGYFEDINFHVCSGEIVGFCGLMGAGRTEIMQSIFGLDPNNGGTVKVGEKSFRPGSTPEAIKNGIAMVTEDRLRQGIIAKLSVKQNMTLAYLKKICKMNFIDRKQESKDFQRMRDAMSLKTAGEGQEIGSLSGGNQQKAIVAKWLLAEPKVFILDEPTRGIDVGSKAEIYKLIGQLAASGKGIILVSSELPEVMGISDRIYVVCQGRIVYECTREQANAELLMKKAFGE